MREDQRNREIKDILVINPGSTSTKIAVFRDKKALFKENVFHDVIKINSFPEIGDQKDYRREYILNQLKDKDYSLDNLSCVVGRGGMLIDLEDGGYRVNEKLCKAMEDPKLPPHASSLGALIAYGIAENLGIPAFIYDSPMGCDILDVAKVTGMAGVEKYGCCHVLNSRAQAMRYAQTIGRDYKDLNLIVCHMGGGITVNAQKNGHIIDTSAYDDGPMAPERSGGVPLLLFKNLIFDGSFTEKEIGEVISGKGGIYSYLGTKDCIEVEERIKRGDEYAHHIYEAMAYQTAKAIAGLSAPLKGKVDGVILTGGLANSKMLTDMIEDYAGHVGKFVVMPGELEMEALAEGAMRMLLGEEEAKEY